MSLAKQLENLVSLSAALDLDVTEAERAERELAKIEQRMRTRDYRINSYTGNSFNVPERVRDTFAELEYYTRIGKDWQRLFQMIGLKEDEPVLDLCPGFTPKVELGLFYNGYRGEVTLLNKDGHALSELLKFLELFSPGFICTTAQTDLSRALLPRHSVIAGNHILDDLVLNQYCEAQKLAPARMYSEEGALSSAWKDIGKDPQRYISPVSKMFCAFIGRTLAPTGVLLLTNYESYLERILPLPQVMPLCTLLREQIWNELGGRGYESLHLQAGSELLQVKEYFILRRT